MGNILLKVIYKGSYKLYSNNTVLIIKIKKQTGNTIN